MLGHSIAEAPIGGAPSQVGAVTPPVEPTITAPGVPRNVVATAGINSISVAFLAPLSDGGAAITGYPVRLSTGEQQTVMASPALFTGLSLVARTAQVAATNSVDTGPYSVASNQVTPTAAPVDPDPDPGPGDGGSGPVVPTSADVHAYTIMRMSTINLKAGLGPSAINLTVSLS